MNKKEFSEKVLSIKFILPVEVNPDWSYLTRIYGEVTFSDVSKEI